MEKRRSQKLLPFLENFFGGGTIIRPRLVAEGRDLRRRRGGGEIRAEEGDGRAMTMMDQGRSSVEEDSLQQLPHPSLYGSIRER